MKKKIMTAALALLAATLFAQTTAPTKRGICYNKFDEGEIAQLSKSKVTWGYNWYQNSGSEEIGPEKEVEFIQNMMNGGK